MSTAVKNRDAARQIFIGLRDFQRRNRAIYRFANTDITLVQLHLLTELESQGPAGLVVLASGLGIPKQECLRQLRKFINDGLAASSESRGRAVYALKPKGKALVCELDKRSDKRLEELFQGTSSEARKAFADLLHCISDTATIPVPKMRPKEHPLRHPLRRITRTIGVIGKKTYGAPASSLEWHVLAQLAPMNATPTIRETAHAVGALENTVRGLLVRLEKRGLVCTVHSMGRRNERRFHITQRGLEVLQQIEEGAIARFLPVVESFPVGKLKMALQILCDIASDHKIDGKQLRIRRITSKKDCVAARKLFIKTIVKHLAVFEPQATLFSPEETSFGLWKEETLAACFSVSAQRSQSIYNVGFDMIRTSPRELNAFIAQALKTEKIRPVDIIASTEPARGFLASLA